MPTNDEIFKQLNLSNNDRKFVTSELAKGSNILDALDGVSSHVKNETGRTVSERSGDSQGGYKNKDSGSVNVMDLTSKGLSGRSLDRQIVEANLSGGSIISGESNADMFLENVNLNVAKGSVAEQLMGNKQFSEFSISGESKAGNKYNFEVMGQPGSYMYRALHGKDKEFYPLSDKQFGKWSDQMKEKTKRMGALESDPYASEIREAWRGEEGTAEPNLEKVTYGQKAANPSGTIGSIMNKFKGIK